MRLLQAFSTTTSSEQQLICPHFFGVNSLAIGETDRALQKFSSCHKQIVHHLRFAAGIAGIHSERRMATQGSRTGNSQMPFVGFPGASP